MDTKPSHKQAFLFTVINYFGIAIGIFSTLFIYPKNKELLGIFRYVESLGQTIFPVLVFGVSQALINFNPSLNDKNKSNLFVFSILSIVKISVLVLIIFIFIDQFSIHFDYIFYGFLIAFFLAMVELFKKQATVLQKIAVPTFFDNIIPKIALPLIFIATIHQFLPINFSLLVYCGVYGTIFFLIYLYLKRFLSLNFNGHKDIFEHLNKKEYYKFSLFALVGSLGSVFAFRIDALMIPNLISMEANGTFSIGVTLASALAIPATGIFGLYTPIISKNIKENNFEQINKDYKAVSKFLFFIGATLYGCVFLGIENLFQCLPTATNLLPSVPIILILGLNVVINMGTGFNGEIITYSKFYRFNLLAILMLIVLNVSLNLVCIKIFHLGIISVAYVSLVSMIVFNLMKMIFIYQKFRLFPFDFSYLKLVLIFIFILLIINYFTFSNIAFYDMFLKCVLYILLTLFLIFKLKLVYQFNHQIEKFLGKFEK